MDKKNKTPDIIIRSEIESDYKKVYHINEKAFKGIEESELVERLRKSDEFIKDLSLVALRDSEVIAHCMFTEISIGDHRGYLALAPVAVLPDYHGHGIGSMIIQEGIKRAKDLGYKGIVVLGHQDYYPKFGFKRASDYGIKCPFEVPDEVYMYLDFKGSVEGVVNYSKAFG